MDIRKTFAIIIFALGIISLAFLFIFLQRRNLAEDEELVRDISGSSNVISKVYFSPSFPSSFETLDKVGLIVTSTGRLSNFELRDSHSGEVFAQGKVLETITKDVNEKLEKISFVIQLALLSNPERNISSWIVKKAAELQSISIKEESSMLSDNTLSNIFPRGSRWVFIPLLEIDSEEIDESLPEYQHYAQKYHGTDASGLKEYIESGLSKTYRKPILLLDISSLFRENLQSKGL